MKESPWKKRATGYSVSMIADAEEVQRAFRLFCDPENACELRALTSGAHVTLDGSDIEGLADAASKLPAGIGIYFVLNPVPSGLVNAARNDDVPYRRWVFIDVDPRYAEKGQSATDAEKEAAASMAREVQSYLGERGWPAPIVVDSGNGVGLYFRADLPNDELVKSAYARILGMLAVRFKDSSGVIDRSVHSAAQLVKLPGTWARKGVASDDRPHRPARILFVPHDLESLTFDELAGVADETPTQPMEGLPVAKAESLVARRALEVGCARIVLSARTDEGRNNALNAVAFELGRKYVNMGSLDRKTVEDRLYEAACESGLDTDDNCGEEGIRKTIASGLGSGEKLPPEPVPTIKGSTAKTNAETPPDALTVSMSAVRPLEVDWLMPDRIPMKFITVMSGRTGIGKSFVALDLIARLSNGGEIPLSGGLCFTAAGTLILSEDPHEYVLAPRLITAGADLKRIHAMTWEAMGKYHLGDTEMLTRACKEVPGGVRVVMIDPPTNFLSDTDEHKNSEVRQLVMKVVKWCLERGVAVIFILHVNKSAKGIEALSRVLGSVAWVTTSRIAHVFCPDPEDKDRCLWIPMKNNLGPLGKAIAYKVVGKPARIEWVGEVETTADEAMNQTKPKERRDVVASEWLIERFRERLEWDSDELFKAGRASGVSRSAIFEAKTLLGLPKARKVAKEDGSVVWVWGVSLDWLASHEPKPEPITTREIGTQLCLALSLAGPMSAADMSERSGFSVKQVEEAMGELVATRKLALEDGTYRIRDAQHGGNRHE